MGQSLSSCARHQSDADLFSQQHIGFVATGTL